MEGYSRAEDELISSACLLNLTWESCYEQVGTRNPPRALLLNANAPNSDPVRVANVPQSRATSGAGLQRRPLLLIRQTFSR